MVGEIGKDLQGSFFGLIEVPSWHWEKPQETLVRSTSILTEILMGYLPNRIPQHYNYIKLLGHMLFKAEL